MPAHTMTPSLPHRSCWVTQHWAYRSPVRRQTRWRPSWWYRQKRDLSEKMTLFQCLWLQFKWRRAHWRQFAYHTGVSWQALKSLAWSRLTRSRCLPGVSVAAWNRSRRCINTIRQSWPGAVNFFSARDDHQQSWFLGVTVSISEWLRGSTHSSCYRADAGTSPPANP